MNPVAKHKTASLAINEEGKKVIKIDFPYDLELLHKVRTLTGRKYHPDNKCWSAPLHNETVDILKNWEFSIDDRLQSHLSKLEEKKLITTVNGIEGLKGELRQFQNAAIAFVQLKNGRAVIGDEQGLGKTIEAIGCIQLYRKEIPVVIVVPASLKLNWQREIEKWLSDPDTEILSGTKPWKTTGDILIINYDIIFAWLLELQRRKPKFLIGDEIQKIKTDKAKRTKTFKKLAKKIPYFLALSGTPIENRPDEIFNAAHIANPDLFTNRWHFRQRYCAPKYNGFGWDFTGHSNIAELHEKLKICMIRRLKKDVLKELPDKTYSFVPIELDNEKEYKNAEKNFISYIREKKGKEAAERVANVEALVKIEALKQLAVKGKMKNVIEWIQDFLETDEKLVVFCTHKFVIIELMEVFKEIAVKVDGSVSGKNRQKAVDEFQTKDKVKLFVGNIEAAGVGITLTAASSLAFIELGWSPAKHNQAEDRIYARLNDLHGANIYYLLAANTIEEKIANLLDTKRKVVDAVLDGIETEQASLLSELMKSYL